MIARLAEKLKYTSGKKQYGYLKAPLKELVNQIVDELAKDERVAKLYDSWYEMRNEVLSTYVDKLPPPLPLSQQKEFKSIKNMVIAEALNIGSHHFTFEPDEEQDISIKDDGDIAAATTYFEKSAKLLGGIPMKKNYLQIKEKLPVSYIFSRLKPPVKRVAYFRRSGKRKH